MSDLGRERRARYRVSRYGAVLLAAMLTLSSFPARVGASGSGAQTRLAQVQFILHGLTVQPPHKSKQKGKKSESLYNKYFLQTKKKQKATIKFKDGTTLHINSQTDAVLQSPHVTLVKKGEVDEQLTPGSNHNVQTAAAVAAAIGTNFDVKVHNKLTTITVVEGALLVTSSQGSVVVKTNQQTTVQKGQAPTPPVPVDGQAAITWTNPLPKATVPINVALDARGGHIVDFSSQYSSPSQGDFWNVKFLIDGRLDFGWETAPGATTNQWAKVGFNNDQTLPITEVIIDPASTHGDSNTSDLKDFEIRVSTATSADSDFSTVFTGTCQQQDSLQIFKFNAPVNAKYIELFAKDNYGSPDWISVAEFEAVSNQPGT